MLYCIGKQYPKRKGYFMTYDFEMLALRIQKRKKAFLTRLYAVLALVVLSLCVIVYNLDKTATFIAGAVIFVSLLYMCFSWMKQNPAVLFSKEIEGVNVKEHEYIERVSQGLLKGTSRRPLLPHTYANRKSGVPRHLIRGTVYLRLPNEDVTSWSGLFPKHMDIYEEGDTLYKPAGARFMIVTSREVKEQPCPLCGAINTKENKECHGCGLLIVHKK